MDDTWHATTHAHLTLLRTGLLDLIDCGPTPDPEPVLRRPAPPEQAATEHATPRPPPTTIRTGQPADPVHRHITARETAIQHALHQLDTLTHDIAVAVADTHRCTPIDQHGNLWPPPAALPTRRTGTGHPTATTGLPTARRTVLERCNWTAAAIDALNDARQATPPHVDTTLIDIRLHHVAARIRHHADRHRRATQDRRPPTTRCVNPHGHAPHPHDGTDGPICATCLRPACADPIPGRLCRRRLNPVDVGRGRTTCGACRVALHRRQATTS